MQSSERPRSVMTYYPSGPVGRVIWTMVFLAIGLVSFAAGVAMLRSQHVVCARAAGICSIGAAWGPLAGTRDVPIAQIKGTRLVTSRAKHGSTYGVVLVTEDGDVALSRQETGDNAQRTKAKGEIDRFLATPGESALDVTYDSTNYVGLAIIAMGGIWLLVAWSVGQIARVQIDWHTRTLWIITVRWPMAPKRRDFPLDAVRDAVVTESHGRKGGAVYGVGLVIDGEEKLVELINAYSSGRGRKDLAVLEIQSMLTSGGGA